MKSKYIIGGIIVVLFLGIGGYSFVNSSVEYASLSKAEESGKKVQVTGTWVKNKGSQYDPKANTFIFHMKDEDGKIARVVLEGAKPNNFDISTSVVAKGKYDNGTFHASEVLTKCPSKYEGKAEEHPEGLDPKSEQAEM
ncbi:MAG: cytochrome C biogenesis protein [Ectothiorhodospiraceae bacterium]|nr:cytochrome C biogenesis protein [Ectothiorhodospiraceae bacterium]